MPNHHTLFDVRGRTAAITGGSGYFGRAMALALAQAGAQVAILARHAESTKTVAENIQAEGGSAIGIACDVLSRASLEQSREQITSAFGPVDILINCAGATPLRLPRQANKPSLTWMPKPPITSSG
jgi:NAD(P)-dependent dehydrogenase (short-subunit alcohol dehydrogenase family)